MQSHATETNQILWFYSFFRFSIWKNYFQLSALPLFTLLRCPLCNAIKTTKATRTVIKKTVSLISKKATLHVQHTLFVHFFDVVLHDCNVKLPETSWLHVLYRKCRTCSCSLFCFSTPAHFFTLVAASISHFLATATKFSCCSSNRKCFLCFVYLFCSSVCIFNIFYGFSYLLEVSFQPWIGPDASASAPRSFVARLVKIVSFFLRWLMGDRVKALRRENDDLKRQLNDLKKEFQSIKSKMAEQKDCHEAAVIALPNTQDVQFLSDSYDALVKSESSLSK